MGVCESCCLEVGHTNLCSEYCLSVSDPSGLIEVKNEFWRKSISNGSEYEGQMSNGRRHGTGYLKFTWRDGVGVYIGQFYQDKIYGKGKFMDSHGNSYEGMWIENKANGFGKESFCGGEVYEGEWFDDLMHGQGTMKYADGAVSFLLQKINRNL